MSVGRDKFLWSQNQNPKDMIGTFGKEEKVVPKTGLEQMGEN